MLQYLLPFLAAIDSYEQLSYLRIQNVSKKEWDRLLEEFGKDYEGWAFSITNRDLEQEISDKIYYDELNNPSKKVSNDFFNKVFKMLPSYKEGEHYPKDFQYGYTRIQRQDVLEFNAITARRILLAEKGLIPTNDINNGIVVPEFKIKVDAIEGQIFHEFMQWWDMQLLCNGNPYYLRFLPLKLQDYVSDPMVKREKKIACCPSVQEFKQAEPGIYFWWGNRHVAKFI